MNEFETLPQEAIACDNYENALAIMKALVEEDNAVLITREENLWMLNWVWCPHGQANRNDVVFMARDDFEWQLDKYMDGVEE